MQRLMPLRGRSSNDRVRGAETRGPSACLAPRRMRRRCLITTFISFPRSNLRRSPSRAHGVPAVKSYETGGDLTVDWIRVEGSFFQTRIDGVGKPTKPRVDGSGGAFRRRPATSQSMVTVRSPVLSDPDGSQLTRRIRRGSPAGVRLLAARRLAGRTRVRGPRAASVFGVTPARPAAQKRRPASSILQSAQHAEVPPNPDQNRALGVLCVARRREMANFISLRPAVGRMLMRHANAEPPRWCCREGDESRHRLCADSQ